MIDEPAISPCRTRALLNYDVVRCRHHAFVGVYQVHQNDLLIGASPKATQDP